MSYRIEKTDISTDIVISGWEEGIQDDPYKGIFDMRNCDVVTIPGEVSVGLSTIASYTPINLSNITFTFSSSYYQPTIGETYQGGKVAYILQVGDTGYDPAIPKGIIVSSANISASVYWHASAGTATGAVATAIGTGQANTNTIISTYGAEVNAAKTTDSYISGAYSDWYLPSKDELNKIYINSIAIGGLGSDVLWSSTEFDASDAYAQRMSDGFVGNLSKNNLNPIRAVRSFTSTVYATYVWAGGTTLPVGTVIRFTNSGGALPTGLTNTDAYYILTTGATTFTISMSAGGVIKIATDAGSGTTTFSVINMGTPTEIVDKSSTFGPFYAMVDNNGRVWGYLADTAGPYNNKWIYLNNLADEIATPTYPPFNNLVFWRGYLFLFQGLNGELGYVKVDTNVTTLIQDITIKSNWDLTWQTINPYKIHQAIVSINDDSIYFCNGTSIGIIAYQTDESINPSQIAFDPANAITYVFDNNILLLPIADVATCLEELGDNLMVGGQNSYIYPWDRVSTNYSTPIFLSENYTTRLVTINTTMYIFCGFKGRIFITNGSNATPFFKIPEYLSKTTNCYIIWTDATFNRNQLYFGFKVTKNDGTVINTMGGLWAVNVDSATTAIVQTTVAAPRLQNIMSYGTYDGYVSAICQFRGLSYESPPSGDGYGLHVGWFNGSNGGMDITVSAPYTGGQSYIDCDPLPVGSFLLKKTLESVQFKLGVPLATGESVELSYRLNINDYYGPYSIMPITQGGQPGDISGIAYNNFENAQWIQIRVTLIGTATNPSFVRLREIRLH